MNTDWSFQRYRNSGIHSIHWYPATFIAALPGSLIPKLVEENSIILDPFCGSGTTAVEAVRLGHKFIGYDINSISTLITKAKLFYPTETSFRKVLEYIIDEVQFENEKITSHPRITELKHWYHPSTIYELNLLLSACTSIKNSNLRNCFLAIFSSILKATCSQGKHWGWVCDNVKPKKSDIIYKDAIKMFVDASEKYINASINSYNLIKDVQREVTRGSLRKNICIRRGDCISHMKSLDIGSVDLILTSPPYHAVADYVKSQRLSYLWFDIEELDKEKLGFKFFNELRKEESGARSRRASSSSRSDYIEFIENFLKQSFTTLKDSGKLALIVGESSSREETTETLLKLAKKIGFRLDFRKERDIVNSKRRLMAKVKSEDILVFTKNITRGS